VNIAASLPAPLNNFEVDVPANTYYDFELPKNSTYPLSGVTYPVDYGSIPGYTGEDGDELDLFVGQGRQGLAGYIIVDRGPKIGDEHKMYVGMTETEVEQVLDELLPVLVTHQRLKDINDLLHYIERFKDK
jgi:inorganic pyrophosphatase